MNLADYRRSVTMASFGGSCEEFCELYCMDGKIPGISDNVPKLNKAVGFSSYPCCDFFASKDGTLFLIEAVQALDIRINIKNKCPHIPWKKITPENNFSNKDVRNIKRDLFCNYMVTRSLRKMLGSMAILSRAALLCDDPDIHFDDLPKYNFWLVIHLPSPNDQGCKDARALDYLSNILNPALQKVLDVSRGLMCDVDVIIGELLARKMRHAGII